MESHLASIKRIESLLEGDIKPGINLETRALEVACTTGLKEFPCSSADGVWEDVVPGFLYQPSDRVWLSLRTDLADWREEDLVLTLDLGAPSTLWSKSAPARRCDGSLTSFQYRPSPDEQVLCMTALIDPNISDSRRFSHASIERIDIEVKRFCDDIEFGLKMLDALDAQDALSISLLNVLQSAIEDYLVNRKSAVRRCRKAIRECLQSASSELNHLVAHIGYLGPPQTLVSSDEDRWKLYAAAAALQGQLQLLGKHRPGTAVQAFPSSYAELRGLFPGIFRQAKNAIQNGRLEPVGSLWNKGNGLIMAGETLVRQVLFSQLFAVEELEHESNVFWIPVQYGVSPNLPQILSKFGFESLILPASLKEVKGFKTHTFNWQGIDGTQIWTHIPPSGVGFQGCLPKEIIGGVLSYRDHSSCDASLYVYGTEHGLEEAHFERLKRGMKAPRYPSMVLDGGLKEFCKEAKNRSVGLSDWVGELPKALGEQSSLGASRKVRLRAAEAWIRDTEWLSCFLQGFPETYPSDDLRTLWKSLFDSYAFDYEGAVSEFDHCVSKIIKDCKKTVSRGLKRIGRNLDSSAMQNPIALFQNSTHPALCSIPWNEEYQPKSLVCGEEQLPVQIVQEFGEQQLVFVTPQAALSTVAIGDLREESVSSSFRLKASPRKLETNELGVRFDGRGHITAITSLEDGMEFIQPGKLSNLFVLSEVAWSEEWGSIRANETTLKNSTSFEVVEKGPVRATVEVVKEFGDSVLKQRISVGMAGGIQFDTWLDWREEGKSLSVLFPLNIHSGRATYDMGYGFVERPTHSNHSEEASAFKGVAHKWVDFSESDQGIALINNGNYNFELKGNVLRMTLVKSRIDDTSSRGIHRFSYMLLPHYGPFQYSGIVSSAQAANSPLRYAPLKPSKGEPGMLPQFVACENRNVVVDCVKKSEADGSIIVRLYECHNSRGRAELFCIREPKSAYLCDLDESVVEDLEISEGLVSFQFKPFEIITIKLKL